MFRYLYHKMRFGSYLHNEHGIKKFAERALGQLTRRVTKKSAFYREMNENLLVEKSNLRLRLDELHEQPSLSAGEFFGVRRDLWASNFMIFAFIVASMFINYVSLHAFITDEVAAGGFLRWSVSGMLAIVLTGGGIVVAERLIETLIPRRNYVGAEADKRSVTPLWAVLLIGIELAILGITEVQADTLATTQESGLLYIGYITLAVMLPLIAGAFRWYTMRFIDRYKTTQAVRQIESRLAQIDSILRQNEEYESNFYKIRSIAYWDQLNEFKTYKDNYNQRRGIEEDLSGHFARTYDTFQAEANKRYESDIRDITAKSIRRLELVEKGRGGRTGSKLDQAPRPFLEQDRPAQSASVHNGSEERPEATETYLSPQPIR